MSICLWAARNFRTELTFHCKVNTTAKGKTKRKHMWMIIEINSMLSDILKKFLSGSLFCVCGCVCVWVCLCVCVASRFLNTWNARRRVVRFLWFCCQAGLWRLVTPVLLCSWVLRTGSRQLRPTSISELVKQIAVVLSNQNVKKKLHVLSKNLKGIIKLQFTDSNSTPSMILLLAGSLLLLQI